jgi:uncharacterized protein YkwD
MVKIADSLLLSRRLFLSVLALPIFGQIAEGRENYLNFTKRIAAAPPDGILFREDLEAELHAKINALRTAKGLSALGPSKAYRNAARAHAADLMLGNRMDHRSSSGLDFDSRMHALHPGELFLPRMGETAARVRRTKLSDAEKTDDIVKQWMKSSTHRKVMVSRDYATVATGIAERAGIIYAVQIFAGPEVRTNVRRAPESQDLY